MNVSSLSVLAESLVISSVLSSRLGKSSYIGHPFALQTLAIGEPYLTRRSAISHVSPEDIPSSLFSLNSTKQISRLSKNEGLELLRLNSREGLIYTELRNVNM